MPDAGVGGGETKIKFLFHSDAWARERICVKWDLRKLLNMGGRCLGEWRGAGGSAEMRYEEEKSRGKHCQQDEQELPDILSISLRG